MCRKRTTIARNFSDSQLPSTRRSSAQRTLSTPPHRCRLVKRMITSSFVTRSYFSSAYALPMWLGLVPPQSAAQVTANFLNQITGPDASHIRAVKRYLLCHDDKKKKRRSQRKEEKRKEEKRNRNRRREGKGRKRKGK